MAAAPDLLGVLLPGILELLSEAEILAASIVCSHWTSSARADQVWIPCCRRRWHFGALLGAPGSEAPGARDQASLEHWERAADEQRKGSLSTEAFRFYVDRCRLDAEVRTWLGTVAEGGSYGASREERGEAKNAILQRGADALDVLLKLERTKCNLQAVARVVRQILSDEWAAKKWAQLLQRPAEAATLEEGALVLSQWARPDADVASMRLSLETLAARATELGARRISEGMPSREEATAMIAAVNTALFTEYGLAGNTSDYYNDGNSLLHMVLSTKKGIPISLSVVWAAVARRCNLSCHPLAGFPAHVLIRIPVRRNADSTTFAEAEDIYVDAFDGGKQMAWNDLFSFLGMRGGAGITEEQLRQCVSILPPVQLYMRMMRNLVNIYQQKGDKARMDGITKQMRVLLQEETS